MLDHLAPPVENFRSRFQSRRHAVASFSRRETLR
jgi:predicted transcriptional regulator